MRIQQVHTPEEVSRFISFFSEAWPGAKRVPLEANYQASLFAGSPSRKVQGFWAEEDGRILATVAAFVDEPFNRHWSEQSGHLHFFEARPEAREASKMLLDEAGAWLKQTGAAFARLSFFFGWAVGIANDSEDGLQTMFHSNNPHYYHSFVKNAGFFTEKGLVELRTDFTPDLESRYRGIVEEAGARGIRLRHWNMDRLEEEGKVFTRLFNETFAHHWGAPQWEEAEGVGFVMEYKGVTIPELTAFAEVDGELAGFVYAQPELNRAGAGLPMDHGVLFIIGVRERFRGRGVNLALAASSYLGMIGKGMKSASYTIVLDDNWPSRRTAEKLGGYVWHSYNVYRKDLGS